MMAVLPFKVALLLYSISDLIDLDRFRKRMLKKFLNWRFDRRCGVSP
jgi:hypothetical protein